MKKVFPISIYAPVIIGLLSLLLLCSAPVSAQNIDPTVPGPLEVVREEYELENEALMTPGFPVVEMRGSVHYPMNWSGGPLPLLVFLHGRHETCFQEGTTTVRLQWPCRDKSDKVSSIDSFKGYDYIARVLASNAYIVVSISANGINASEANAADNGAAARAELIQKHLKLWQTFNTTGGMPFGTRFMGKVDMERIGTMGHSRGGEGVLSHYLYNQTAGAPFNIKAVFALAPIDTKINNFKLNNVPLAVLLPYCDGDVTRLDGVHFYDRVRYNAGMDTAPKHTILVLGANHNFYNQYWTPSFFLPGAKDDVLMKKPDSTCKPGSSERLTEDQQRATGLMYVAAFLRVYVGGESQFLPLLTGAMPPLPSAGTSKIYVSFHAPNATDEKNAPAPRRDVNRLEKASELLTNTLGGDVTRTGLPLYEVCGGPQPIPPRCLDPGQHSSQQPHAYKGDELNQLKLGWNDASASLINDLPPGKGDITQFQALQFRASLKFDDSRNSASTAQNFRVALKDGTGATASVRVADFSPTLFFPPGSLTLPSFLPRAVLNTVRLPLSAFTNINLADIRSVSFLFDQQSQGALLITDIAFASAAHISLPTFSSDACLKDDTTGSELIFNSVTGNYIFCYAGGLTMSGVGKITVYGNTVSLVQGANETDRRLTVTLDRGTGRGTASLQSPAGKLIGSITNRNMANSACSCATAP